MQKTVQVIKAKSNRYKKSPFTTNSTDAIYKQSLNGEIYTEQVHKYRKTDDQSEVTLVLG